MQSNTLKKILAGLSFLLLISISLSAQEGNPINGKEQMNGCNPGSKIIMH